MAPATTLTLEDKLKRLVYLNNTQHQFFVGNPDVHQNSTAYSRYTTFGEVLQNDLEEFLLLLEAASKDNNLPRRSNIFCILGLLMNNKNIKEADKSKITAKVLEFIQSDEEFLNFIKYYTRIRSKSKIPSSVEKVVRKFYNNKSPLELAQSFAKFKRMHRWSHKDLIKLGHVKSDSILKNVVINYILTGKVSDTASEEQLQVLDIMRKSDELRKTKESFIAVPILTTHKLTMNQVSPSLHSNGEVWYAAIQNMSIQQILPCLGKLYKSNLLKVNSEISRFLADLFTSAEKVKASGVHTIEIFISMKRFEKGGKPLDQKLLHYLQNEKKLPEADLKKAQTRIEPKATHIVKALSKCFDLACSNISPTNKRYLVTIDVSADAKKALCIGNKVLTLLEAAVAYTIMLVRVEKDVVIAVNKGDQIELVSVEKKVSFSELLEKVKSKSSSYSLLFAPVDWAASEKKHVDVFVTFIHNEYASKVPKEKDVSKIRCEPLIKYRSKVNLPNSKFVVFAPINRNEVTKFEDTPTNVLEILGFDATACKVAECFFRGAFC